MNVNLNRKSKEETEAPVIHDMTFVSPDRNRKDVGKLKGAIEASERIELPNRTYLYDFYHDIMTIDAHLAGVIQKRKDAVINKEIRFVDAKGAKVEGIEKLIESKEFTDLISILLDKIFWGCTGVEFIVGEKFAYKKIPKKHINVEKGTLKKSQYDSTGVPISEHPFVWVVGDDYDLGKLLNCMLYGVYKRSGFGDFAQFVEIFGQPVRIMYYDAHDTKTKEELRDTLHNSGGSLAMMIPKQAEFSMLDGKSSNGDGKLQLGLINACNDEMSVAILGNTETTTSSSSSGYAQSSTHSKEQLEITKSDLRLIEQLLNSEYFIGILKSYGYDVAGGKFEFEKELDLEALKLRLDIDKVVSEKVPFPPQYWYDTYGIPMPEKGEIEDAEVIEEEEPEKPKAKEKKGTETEDEEKNLSASEESFFQRLKAFFFRQKADKINISDYYKSVQDLADGNNDFEAIYSDLSRRIYDGEMPVGNIDPALMHATAQQLTAGMSAGLGGNSFDYDDSRNELKAHLQRNLVHFSAAKSLTEMIEYRDLMLDPRTGEVLPFYKYRRALLAKGKVFSEAYLKVEYDNAKTSAILAHKWDTLEAVYLEYTTVGDSRVRPDHQRFDGLTYPKDHAIWGKLYPPNGYRDRCTVAPGAKAKYKPENEDIDEKEISKQVNNTVFENNVGQSKLIFNNNHPYFENLSTKELRALNFSNYGMQSIDNILRRKHPTASTLQRADYDTFFDTISSHENGAVFTDSLGNNVLFSNKNFIANNKKKYGIVANIEDIISNADEIYSVMSNEKSKLKTNYIKYYDGKALLIETEGTEAVRISQIRNDRARRGILMHRK